MGILQIFSEHRFAKCLQATSSDLQLPQKLFFHRKYLFMALMAAVNQTVITKVVANYKTTF